jgi:hypothetical protein
VAEREVLLGFRVRISPPRGLTPATEFVLELALALYFFERELKAEGGPLNALIRSGYRSLTAVDQADLLIWLFFGVEVPEVVLGPLVPVGTGRGADFGADGGGAALRVLRSDPVLAALAVLYRQHRIDAGQFLGALGGKVLPGVR